MSAIKLGDRYAVVGGGLNRQEVNGPYYVVRVRRSRVAIARAAEPNPKAALDWKEHGGNLSRIGARWDTSTIEPWTDAHDETMLRQKLSRRLLRLATDLSRYPSRVSAENMREALRLIAAAEEKEP